MSNPAFEQFSLFRSQIYNRRFDDETFRVLESVLVSKDVKSLIEVRLNLREFMRSESKSVIREIAEKTVEQKLSILEFFVRAFALIGDIESCLALRYEAFVLRDLKCTSCKRLQVSQNEWLSFVEQLLENGFYATAGKACEYIQSYLQRNANSKPQMSDKQVAEKIMRLKDCAVALTASHSVQAHAAEYLKKKTIARSEAHSSYCKEKQIVASTCFRNGIKRRNVVKLHELQDLQKLRDH